MSHRGKVIRTPKEFQDFVDGLDVTRPVAVDVETYKQRPSQLNAKLLGLAITAESKSGELVSAYITLCHYNKLTKMFEINEFDNAYYRIGQFLRWNKLVGWNVSFDKMWLDECFDIDTQWKADGRILWHLQALNFPVTIETTTGQHQVEPRGYGLKLAQKLVLGWEETNERILEEHVAMAGGRLEKGDHYLADLDVLSHYACLDTYSTLIAYHKLWPFIEAHNYQGFVNDILQYALVLRDAAISGLPVDEAALRHAAALFKTKREQASYEIRKVCENEIAAIEDAWKVRKLANYKTAAGRERFLASYGNHKRFNPSSSQQRALLLHDILEFPVLEKTPTGQARTDRANLAAIPHNSAQAFIMYSECKKVAEAAQTYLNYIEDGSLYTNYDVCGTVSGRLSGFKPSVLNMPFSDPEVMSAFTCVEGYIGIHADLAAIEPCVLAHYSEDPTLMKCYKEGMGDIYLDLALDIFPDRKDLYEAYDPTAPIKSEVKEQFKELRAVCKIIHLAVSYTGTHITVAKNLSKSGFLTSKPKAMQLVGRYWRKFARVKAFNSRLQEIYKDKGYVRNLSGRIIRVPTIYRKDLLNRLVQSSAHDLLRMWVMEITRLFNERGVVWRHWLPDLHDSTTFMVHSKQPELARQCYLDALKSIEDKVQMSVPLRCELKFCRTLAGLKGDEL